MAKVIRSITTILVILILAWFVWSKLQSNKALQEKTARLAEQINDIYPVEVAEAEFKELSLKSSSTGKLMPNKMAYLISDTQGKVLKLYKRRGDNVKKGEVIAKVDDTQLQTQLDLAQTGLEKVNKDEQRFENLLEGEAITQRQIEEAAFGKKQVETNIDIIKINIENTALKAPMAGNLSMVFIEEGMFVGGGMKIAELVDVSRLKLLVRVSEEVVVNLEKGQSVQVVVDVFPEEAFPGAITMIAVNGDFGGKYQVEITLKDKKGLPIKAGMFARAVFESEQTKGLFIPRRAIFGSIQNSEVYVLDNGQVRLQKLEIGYHDSDKVEVLEGLKEGDRVVVNGQINLVDGRKVEVME